jgi:hypothetical protein
MRFTQHVVGSVGTTSHGAAVSVVTCGLGLSTGKLVGGQLILQDYSASSRPPALPDGVGMRCLLG